MCGRFTYLFTWRELHELMTLTSRPSEELRARYNVAPTQLAPVIRDVAGGREGLLMRWGLVPSWADDLAIGNRMINARGETVAEKPAFRAAMKSRRCLVPVSGFYEWQAIEGQKVKQPWFIHRADTSPLFLAGLWERWDKGESPVETFTIITTTANRTMAPLHDRMPVIVENKDRQLWLDLKLGANDVIGLIRPAGDDVLVTTKIGTRVNSPKNDDASVLHAVDGA